MSGEARALVFTFPTIHAVLRAEKSLAGAGFKIEAIPVPTGISSDCGFCLRWAAGDSGDKVLASARALSPEAVWLETTIPAARPGMKERNYERIE